MKYGYTIFDAHAHVFPQKIAERATSSISTFYDDMPMCHVGSMEQLLESGTNAGVDGIFNLLHCNKYNTGTGN